MAPREAADWAEVKCARAFSIGSLSSPSLTWSTGGNGEEVTYQTHHRTKGAARGMHPKSQKHQCTGAGDKAGVTNQGQPWEASFGFRMLSSLYSLYPQSDTFFLLPKESALKPECQERVEGGSFCTFCPRRADGRRSSIQIGPPLQDPAHSAIQSKPSSRPPSGFLLRCIF